MKILLLNAPPLKRFGIVGQIYPPLGILYLAAYLRKKAPDIEIQAIDGYQEPGIDEVEHKIKQFSPDVLGVSFTTQAATGAYALAEALVSKKNRPLIVAGGPHATIYPGEAISRGRADAVVRGEGEETFAEIIDCLRHNRNYRSVAGTVCLDGDRATQTPLRPLISDLDTIPFPARDLLDLRKYPGYHYKKEPWDTSFLSGRGCPYNCVYCSNPIWKLQKPWMRLRSPRNIADEIEYLKETYGIREFYDQTDLFNGNLRWAKEVCDELIRRKLGIRWKVQMTVQNIDEELAEKMHRSGCWLVLLGIETGNDATAAGINKRSNRHTAEKSLTLLKKHGLKTLGLFMAFNVWEEEERLVYEDRAATLATLSFAGELVGKGWLDVMTWSLTTPYPGSTLFEIARRHKLIPDDLEGHWELWDSSENFLMRLPGVSPDDWREVQRRGKWLQARLLLRSGTLNLRSVPLYAAKIKNLVAGILHRH